MLITDPLCEGHHYLNITLHDSGKVSSQLSLRNALSPSGRGFTLAESFHWTKRHFLCLYQELCLWKTLTRLFFMLNNWPLWHLCNFIGYIFRVIYLQETVGITQFCCLHDPIFPVTKLSWRLSSRWMSSAPAYTSADRDVTALLGSHDEVGAPFLALIAISSM